MKKLCGLGMAQEIIADRHCLGRRLEHSIDFFCNDQMAAVGSSFRGNGTLACIEWSHKLILIDPRICESPGERSAGTPLLGAT